MDWNAHLPARIGDLAASLANCARLKSVFCCCLDKRVKDDAEARIGGDSPFKLMTSLMVKASRRSC